MTLALTSTPRPIRSSTQRLSTRLSPLQDAEDADGGDLAGSERPARLQAELPQLDGEPAGRQRQRHLPRGPGPAAGE